MEENSGKFLVNFIDSFSRQEIFFGFWIFIVVSFVIAARRFLNHQNQRNFRPDSQKPYHRAKGKSVVPKGKDLSQR